jgi:hypothetical protein
MVTWTGASPFLLAGACASKKAASPEVTAALAPSGRLRASINLGNPILARREPAGGEAVGVSVDLSRRLAEELGVGLVLLTFDSAAKSVEAIKGGQADIGFFAIDPMRSDGIRFTAPYVLIEGAYLVRQASPLTANAEVDRPGTRIMVGRGSAYDLFPHARAEGGAADARADLAEGGRRVPRCRRRRRRRRQAAARGRCRPAARPAPPAGPLHGDRAGDGPAGVAPRGRGPLPRRLRRIGQEQRLRRRRPEAAQHPGRRGRARAA